MNTGIRLIWRRPLGVALLLVLLISLIAPLGLAAAQTDPTATVTAPRLTIRTGPGASYARITSVGFGERVTLIGRDSAGAWARVRTAGGVVGWASTFFLDTGGQLRNVQELRRVEPQVFVAPPRLNVRAAPAANATVIATLVKDEVVNVRGRSANSAWLFVHFGGDSLGWIASGEITPRFNFGIVPVTDAGTPTPGAPPVSGVAGVARSGHPPIRVNTAAGVDHGTITHLNAGEQVQILGRSGDIQWVYIFFRGNTLGWVAWADLITSANFNALPVVQGLPVGENQRPPGAIPTTPAPTPTPATPTAPSTATATVNTGALNVRSGPGFWYPVVTTVYQGKVLNLTGRIPSAEWLRVSVDGHTGWVDASFVHTFYNVRALPELRASRGDF